MCTICTHYSVANRKQWQLQFMYTFAIDSNCYDLWTGRNRVTNEIETKIATNGRILFPIYFRFVFHASRIHWTCSGVLVCVCVCGSLFFSHSRRKCSWLALQTIIISIIVYETLLSLVNCSYYQAILLSFGCLEYCFGCLCVWLSAYESSTTFYDMMANSK